MTDSAAPRGNRAISASTYIELNRGDWVPRNYDHVMYEPGGYDAFIWSLQQPLLLQIVQSLAADGRQLAYLDFACGTGRILATVEPLTHRAIGLDTSAEMLAFAREKVERAELKNGNILDEPEIIENGFDLITAFRFFLNTEPELRLPVMRSLAQRLAGPESRLIFNIHANTWSSWLLTSAYQRLRGWGPATTMSYSQIRRLIEDAGLEIESWYGFGLWPHRLYRTRLSPVLRQADRLATHRHALRWISHDLLFVCRPVQSA